MHHLQRKKYQGMKDAGMTAEELKAEMVANGITEADAEQFIAEAYGDNSTSPVTPPEAVEEEQEVVAVTGKSAAAVVAASTASITPATTGMASGPKFDYRALTGKEYEAYIGYVASLPLFELRQFDQFKAQPVMKERYPGMPNSPWDMVGIEITTDKPVNTTKIDVKTANELNAQLANSRRIYLLKQ